MTVGIRLVTVPIITGCLLVVAACGSDDGPGAGTTPATSSTASAGSAAARASGSPAVTSGGQTPAESLQLVLEADGLGMLTGTSIRHLPFGTDVGTLTAVLEKGLGTVSTQSLPECGQGARLQLSSEGFAVLVDGAAFVGWTASDRTTKRLTTASGVGVGSTLATVRAAYSVSVTEGSLGPEFSTSTDLGLGGLLDGSSPTSKVTTLYAGETCFFR